MLYLAPYVGIGTKGDPFRPRGTDGVKGWGAFDLRPDPTRLAGQCLLWLPEQVAHASMVEVGIDPDESLTSQRRAVIGNRLGLDLADEDSCRKLLSSIAFRPGRPWAQVKPSRRSQCQDLVMAGRLWASKPVRFTRTGFVDPTDDFNRADESPIAAPWATPSGQGNFIISSNQVTHSGGGTDHVLGYRSDFTPDDDQYSQVRVTALGSDADCGPAVRMATSGATYYGLVGYQPDEQILKFVSGSYSLVTSVTMSVSVNGILKITADGSTIEGFYDGGSVGSQTDASISSGRVGMVTSVSAGAIAMDDWEGGDLPIPGGLPGGTLKKLRDRRAA